METFDLSLEKVERAVLNLLGEEPNVSYKLKFVADMDYGDFGEGKGVPYFKKVVVTKIKNGSVA